MVDCGKLTGKEGCIDWGVLEGRSYILVVLELLNSVENDGLPIQR